VSSGFASDGLPTMAGSGGSSGNYAYGATDGADAGGSSAAADDDYYSSALPGICNADTWCPTVWIGDGWCDDICMNAECDNDGGDCDSAKVKLAQSNPAKSKFVQAKKAKMVKAIQAKKTKMKFVQAKKTAKALQLATVSGSNSHSGMQLLGFGYVAAACVVVIAGIPALRSMRNKGSDKPLLSGDQKQSYSTDIL